MKFRRYAVTVHHAAPWKDFFTYWGALRFYFKHQGHSHLYVWGEHRINGDPAFWKKLK